MRLKITLFIGWLCWAAVSAQNPFDLTHRLPKPVPAGEAGVRKAPENPFDVVAHRRPARSVLTGNEAPVIRRLQPRAWYTAIPRGDTLSASAILGVLIGLVAFLSLAIALNRTAVLRAWRGFLTDTGLALAQRESQGLAGNTPYYFLYVNFLLNAGFFFFLITKSFRGNLFNNWLFLLVCFVLAWVVFLSKHLLISMMSALFNVEKDAGRYNFLIVIFNCVLGLFLLPFNFIIAFANDIRDFLVSWTVGLVLVFYAYRAIRASRAGLNYLAVDQFHFLLYLCAVEIAPVMLIVKLVSLPKA